MKAIVLCGGLGTRLGALTQDTPKPLIEVAGRPFLQHVLEQLRSAPIDGFVLAVSFHWEKVRALIGEQWQGLPVQYSVESTPLGTGGAIRQAMRQGLLPEALVANGDTLIRCDAGALAAFGRQQAADIAITLKHVEDSGRFGRVRMDIHQRVQAFEEKGVAGPGYINAGVYWVKSSIFDTQPEHAFSLEQDVLARQLQQMRVVAQITDGYFIDIGVPADLARARTDFAAPFTDVPP
jgi:D-glycero-alpha-D-manno-heptose 1-phosphate guanylyltransferase